MGREMRSAQSMGWKIRFIPYPCSPVAAWPRDHLADYESIGEEVVSPQVEYYLIAMTAKAIYSVFTTSVFIPFQLIYNLHLGHYQTKGEKFKDI